ncbi:hypothetical protein BHE74_00034303 [Ensete ventricosum]|nr:hypothetical protein BHE74_00034303 [Ensete ventricosum]
MPASHQLHSYVSVETRVGPMLAPRPHQHPRWSQLDGVSVESPSQAINATWRATPSRHTSAPTDSLYTTTSLGVSAEVRPSVWSTLRLGSDELLAQFVGRFAAEVRGMPDAHPSLAIQIDIIVGGPISGGDSSSTQKAYVQSAVEKRPTSDHDLEITFGIGNEMYPDHNDTLVISA